MKTTPKIDNFATQIRQRMKKCIVRNLVVSLFHIFCFDLGFFYNWEYAKKANKEKMLRFVAQNHSNNNWTKSRYCFCFCLRQNHIFDWNFKKANEFLLYFFFFLNFCLSQILLCCFCTLLDSITFISRNQIEPETLRCKRAHAKVILWFAINYQLTHTAHSCV